MIRRGVFVDGARPRKLKNFEAAEYPPPIARRPRTEARSMSLMAFFIWLIKLDFGAACTLNNCSIFAFLNIQLLEPLLLLIKFGGPFDFFFALGFDDENGHDLFFFFFGGIFTEANAKYPRRIILKAINNPKTICTCCVEAHTRYHVTSSQAS